MEIFIAVLVVATGAIAAVLILGRKERERRLQRASAEVALLPKYKAAYGDLDIVAERCRQPVLRKLWDYGDDKTWNAIMIPENNPHDGDAVRVEIEGRHVGNLSCETAKQYRSHMNGQRCAIPVHLVMGDPRTQ